ncbi:MAG: DUF5723 family protein [Flavobacteriaceae bacterium]|nr:DUF5723 family protein [Flavobacteriaceae bacterium]
MKIKLNNFLILFLCINTVTAQNKKILFGFDEIPQSLMVNPGTNINYNRHIGIPLLSGAYIHAGLTGFSIADLFANDGIDINSKLRNLLEQTNRNDYYTVNQQLELFNFGFRLKNPRDYVSFGFYQEFDGIIYHPKDIVTLALEGNQEIGRAFNLEDLSFKASLIGVYHIGINRKINRKLTVGVRGKIYLSVFNTTSVNNSGVFITETGENNFYNLQLVDANLSLRTSGIVNNNAVFSKFLFSGNMGLGVDLGLTYKLEEGLEISASILDLGFIRHRKDIRNYGVKGNQMFEGLNLLFPTEENNEYWQSLEDEFEEDLPLDTLNVKYTTTRSTKLNGSFAYRFGKKNKNDCLRSESKNKLPNEIGIQLYTILRPRRPQFATTLYYYRRLTEQLRIKTTYTVDDYNFTNIGFGLTTHFKKYNFYVTADNLLGYVDLSKSKNQAVQFGMNLIFE